MTEPASFLMKSLTTEDRRLQHDIPDSSVRSKSAAEIQQEYKSRLKEKCGCIHNEACGRWRPALLSDVFTELFITTGESHSVNHQHEVQRLEEASSRRTAPDLPIRWEDIFKAPVRCVMTTGVAGVGKTVSVQKFTLDWAEGHANQHIDFVFPLPFRELNLMKAQQISLLELLRRFRMDITDAHTEQRLLFIFDGLDECRFPLDFHNNGKLSDPAVPASIDRLLTNLIGGTLLPDSLVWITSRPAAASQIPLEHLDLLTEVRGFTDPQKEQYLHKSLRDPRLSSLVSAHLRSSRSLYIMCHIPIFCWLSVMVLERMLSAADPRQVPKTLTQMYTHFLLIQARAKNLRYGDDYGPDLLDEDMILKLGKLAFRQLQAGNLIFYEEDLVACGIEVKEAVVYSGVCSQIFREESMVTETKVYCFIHLSVQEFLAALYVLATFQKHGRSALDPEEHHESLLELHKRAVERALRSENGHLDLFLRFLLGLSLESNQVLLRGLLAPSAAGASEHTAQFIRKKIEETSSPEKSINLFHCLNELNEVSLVKEVQRFLHAGHLSGLSPAQWSALVFVLLTSEEKLDVFDLKKYVRSDEGLIRLLPVLRASESALLDNCGLTVRCCRSLSSAVSNIRALDLSNNAIGDRGLELLTAGLTDTNLHELRLSYCRITTRGCDLLESALLLKMPNLRVLDLSENSLREAGVKILAGYLRSPLCKLEILRLKDCRVTPRGCFALAAALQSNPSHLRELDLHWNNPGDDGVEKLSALIQNPRSRLQTLWLSYGLLTEQCCRSLSPALSSSSSTVTALDLSGNAIYDDAVRALSAGLDSPHCRLEILRLASCEISAAGVSHLASALGSHEAPLRELDLRQNLITDAGVQWLADVLEKSICRVETLRLGDGGITEEGCSVLAAALMSNPAHLRELDLSRNQLTDAAVQGLCAVLRDHCHISSLDLSQCGLTALCCDWLAAALAVRSSSLRELSLGMNDLQDVGVRTLCVALQNPQCQLTTLRLWSCGLSGESCSALASALTLAHSTLRELDLSENSLTDAAVTPLALLLDEADAALETLTLF